MKEGLWKSLVFMKGLRLRQYIFWKSILENCQLDWINLNDHHWQNYGWEKETKRKYSLSLYKLE